MRPLDFVAAHLGKRLTLPGGDGECVDLANAWIDQAWNLPRVYRNAVDWSKEIGGMVWTPNGPTNSPPAGAVVVWGAYSPLSIGPFGHVAVCLMADPMHLITIDQNWQRPEASLVLHSYGGVLGWHSVPE